MEGSATRRALAEGAVGLALAALLPVSSAVARTDPRTLALRAIRESLILNDVVRSATHWAQLDRGSLQSRFPLSADGAPLFCVASFEAASAADFERGACRWVDGWLFSDTEIAFLTRLADA